MQFTVTKRDLIWQTMQYALNTGRRKSVNFLETETVVDCLLAVIRERLLEGHKVSLARLGILSTKTLKERTVRDPITHQLHTVPARRHVRWHTSKRLKRELQEPQQK